MSNEDQNRIRKTLGEDNLKRMAEEHIANKLRAVEIMKDTSVPMETREAEVLKIVKHKMYLPIIKLMAGLPE